MLHIFWRIFGLHPMGRISGYATEPVETLQEIIFLKCERERGLKM